MVVLTSKGGRSKCGKKLLFSRRRSVLKYRNESERPSRFAMVSSNDQLLSLTGLKSLTGARNTKASVPTSERARAPLSDSLREVPSWPVVAPSLLLDLLRLFGLLFFSSLLAFVFPCA